MQTVLTVKRRSKETDVTIDLRSIQSFQFQVGGHMPLFSLGDGRLIKPGIPKEIECYELIYEQCRELIPWTAPYFGTVEFPVNLLRDLYSSASGDDLGLWSRFIDSYAEEMAHESDGVRFITFIVLRDLTWGVSNPTIIDIKLGLFVPLKTLSAAKLKSHQSKYYSTTSSSMGLRLCGLRSRHGSNDKYWGRELDDLSLGNCLRGVIPGVVDVITISYLQALSDIIERGIMIGLYSASLLIIIDEDRADCRISIIDFAHSGDKIAMEVHGDLQQADFNYGVIFGLHNLIHILQSSGTQDTPPNPKIDESELIEPL